jgi:hypothetical protein
MARKVFAFTAIFALLAALCAWPAPAQKAAHVTGVTAQAEPAEYDGPCPKMFRFTGVITVDRPGRVKYRWFHSDGRHRPPATTFFASPSAHTVRDSWTLGSSSARSHYNGHVRLRILWPSTGLSDQATFTLRCVPRTR